MFIIILIWLINAWPLDVSASTIATQSLQTSRLSALSGERDVKLSHVLELSDFPAEGGTVKYHLDFFLQEISDTPLGIYIQKISLSGKLYLNGQLVATCGNARLEHLRCLHQPQFFKIPAALLRQGKNTLIVEVYATSRQSNGLSVVHLGEADAVYSGMYSWRHFITAELQMGLIYLSGLLGVAALIASRTMREKKLFIWYGLTCILNALASLNGVVANPHVNIDFFNWLVFSSRLGSVVLTYIFLLSIFNEKNKLLIRILLSYFAAILLSIYLTNNDKYVVIALYVPLIGVGVPIIYMSMRGIFKIKRSGYLISAFTLTVMLACGLFDFYKLFGNHVFDNIYLLPYANGFALVVMGLILIYRISKELVDSQKSAAMLQQQVDQRSAFELTKYIPIGTYTIRVQPGEVIAKYTFLSQRFIDLTGLDPDRVYHNPAHAFDCLHPEDKDAWIHGYAQSLKEKTVFIRHARFIVNGQVRWVVAESTPRQLADGSTVWEGVLTDETNEVIARQILEEERITLQMHLMERSRLEEREQLLRDVHDGFGSQLASVRMMVERGYVQPDKLNNYLQELSVDLHLVVDTLGQPDITLEDAFYDMRYRIGRYFSNSKINFEWTISLEKLPVVESRTTLQIQRIAQEAINNAVKHARACKIEVKVNYHNDEGILSVSILDDGEGIPIKPPKGRGISNMRHRARMVNGNIKITLQQPGTEVLLTINFQ